ncbi:MAG: hypothetical protein K5866_04955 [Treponema sp.]|nr:hypothetical protein [Treponema sp.]
MKGKYQFRKKALEFARRDNFDSVSVNGFYQEYEVYIPYCKEWKNSPPKTGLPPVILVNENEVKWGNPYDPFSILNNCKKFRTDS